MRIDGPDWPTTVWPVAQQKAPDQRKGRYVPESMAHPGKMIPAIVRQAVERFTASGDLVVDPMCGIGTTLVEAAHLGRDGLGVEYEPRWAEIAARNVALAIRQGATGQAQVVSGDARRLEALVPAAIAGTAALVVTSPPYGPDCHGQPKPRAEQAVRKRNHCYSDDRANLAYVGTDGLVSGFKEILGHCERLLRPGGTVVITARPWRQGGELVDLPGAVLALAPAVGLAPVGRHVALLAAVRQGELISRHSFFQLLKVREARTRGIQASSHRP